MAANGGSLAQTARIFMVDPDTIAGWMKRIHDDALIQTPVPINKFPDLVHYIVQRLKILCPLLGKKRLAQLLTIAGMKISSSSVGRFLNQKPIPPPDPSSSACHGEAVDNEGRSRITAKYPNHVPACNAMRSIAGRWHIDLTVVPTSSGFRTTWFPFSLPQCWPFAYWVAIIIDHFSRKIIGFAVFNDQPDSFQIRSFIGRAIRVAGKTPKYIISDKGPQFFCHAFKDWCKRKKIKPRYGAIGKYGSIAIIERLIRSMKSECTRRILIPLRQSDMRYELGLYVTWYNELRPHQSLEGRTPQEIYDGLPVLRTQYETRGRNGVKLKLSVSYFNGRKHLPIVSLQNAA